jgi:zinc transporter ZupT
MLSENDGVITPHSASKIAHDSSHEQAVKTEEPESTVSKSAAIILVLAIGAHNFFEGIAFGLQRELGSAGQLAAGILIHKTAAAVSLGGAFARSGYTTRQIILFLGIFSLIAPIGIIIGMQIASSNKLVDVIF